MGTWLRTIWKITSPLSEIHIRVNSRAWLCMLPHPHKRCCFSAYLEHFKRWVLFSKYIFLKFGLCIQDSEELTDINSPKQAEQNQILGSPELSKNALSLVHELYRADKGSSPKHFFWRKTFDISGYNLTSPFSNDANSSVLTYHRIIEAFKFSYAWRSGLEIQNLI